MSAAAAISGRRAFAEMMITGGATLLLYPLSWGLRKVFDPGMTEYHVSFVFFYLAWVINDPHFAVTYLLFYRDIKKRALSPETPLAQRARWIFSGVIAPIVLVTWGILAIRMKSAVVLGAQVQFMYMLVGWHYVKQGFGVVNVLGARRGFRLDVWERRAILFHCFAGWAYAWASPASPPRDFEEKGVIYTGIAHPRWLEVLSLGALIVSCVGLVAVVVLRKKRTGKFMPFSPVVGLLMSIWSWTIFSGIDPLVRYAIPALHSIQYLFFVYLLGKNKARAEEGAPKFGRPVAVRLAFLTLGALALGAILFHFLPEFLDLAFWKKAPAGDVPDPIGDTPFFAAVFTFVNVHHYFMDHVIWRRENPETKYLQDVPAKPIPAPAAVPERLAA
jgi:hypothetical protein